ncbi:hypothetical protein WJX72_003119 [[Myrmecia] bisecta]|uniref:Uncharacterized protein n=1 Tax=[Myrmecia] bisecta TaxID=41462 RepID=A0AAW1PCE2_9CHLO
MECKAAEINDDNIRLVNQLTQENAKLEADVLRLSQQMTAGISDGDVQATLISMRATNDRLVSHKNQMLEENIRLATKNGRLVEENEALLARIAVLVGDGQQHSSSIWTRFQAFKKIKDKSMVLVKELPDENTRPAASQEQLRTAQEQLNSSLKKKRHLEISEQVRQPEESQEGAARRRQDLMQRSSYELAAHEQAYEHAKAGALSRLNSYISSLAERPVTPRGQSSERADATLTPDQLMGQMMHTRIVPGVPQGELDEGKRRRQEAELAKAELEKKVAASRARHQAAAVGAAPALQGGKELEEQRRIAEQRQKAQEQVRAAYYRFAGKDGVGKFLQALGFQGFKSRPDDDLSEVFRSAIRFTQPERIPGPPKWDSIFTQAVHQKLQEWYSEWIANADL